MASPDYAKAPPTPAQVSVLVEGDHFVFRSDNSHPFYVSDKDTKDHSSCEDACAATWVPLIASPDAQTVGSWTFAIRKDGSRQWAYKGRPVYTYAKDVSTQATGDGIDGQWHLLKP
jgi:predicted lipoprotein with Yx(FWY)xxD motif